MLCAHWPSRSLPVLKHVSRHLLYQWDREFRALSLNALSPVIPTGRLLLTIAHEVELSRATLGIPHVEHFLDFVLGSVFFAEEVDVAVGEEDVSARFFRSDGW